MRIQCPYCRAKITLHGLKTDVVLACPRCKQWLKTPPPPPAAPKTALILPDLVPTSLLAVPASPPPVPETPVKMRKAPARPFTVLLALGLLGGAVIGGALWLRPAPGIFAENRDYTRMAEEEIVRRYILNNSDQPEKIRFLAWGPHMAAAEMNDLTRQAGLDAIRTLLKQKPTDNVPEGVCIIRVVYEGDSKVLGPLWIHTNFGSNPHDHLFVVLAGKLVQLAGLESGNDWKKKLRKQLAKTYPGIEIDP